MNKSLSLYLDLIRFLAATAVFFAHVPMFIGGYFWQLGAFGHQAVVIFFLLSGFVISFVVEKKEKHLSQYIINRASRIYSVAIPAIFLAYIIYFIGLSVRPEVFSSFNGLVIPTPLTLLSALSFTNQAWVGINVFANPPYWSLSYEVLYYIFFAIVFYLRGIKRIILAAVSLIIMGPSIILYLPIWLLGVYCYKNSTIFSRLETWKASLGFVGSIVAIFLLSSKNAEHYINSFAQALFGDSLFSLLLHPAQNFLIDYLLALCVAGNILVYPYVFSNIKDYINSYEEKIRFLANYTFSTYLYHFPILCLYSIYFPFDDYPVSSIFLTLIATPLTVWLLGYYTERHKKQYRAALIKLFKVNIKSQH